MRRAVQACLRARQLACALLLWPAALLAAVPEPASAPGVSSSANQASAALPQPVAELRLEPALEAQLLRLVWRAYDRPEEALRTLQLLPQEPDNPRRALQLRFAEARIAVFGGNFAKAQALVTELAAVPGFSGHVALLRAELLERQGQPEQAVEFAQMAVTTLERGCPADDLRASVASSACDFRAVWAALRILQRKQNQQGALPFAEATEMRALALAELGDSTLLRVLSLGGLARNSQAQQQVAAARRWMVRALQTAQGDPVAMAHAKIYESSLAAQQGDAKLQLQALEEGLAFAQQADAVRVATRIQVSMADNYLHRGQPELALKWAYEALPLTLQFQDLAAERSLRHNLGVAYILLRKFDQARPQMARAEALRQGQTDQGLRLVELREEGEAWAAAGQAKKAIEVYHAERKLNTEVHAIYRAAALKQLQVKYDSERKQSELDLLARDSALKDRQLDNRSLVTQVGVAVAALLMLSLMLTTVMVRRVRAANKRLKANEALLRAQSERDPLTDLANRRHFLGVMASQPDERFSGALLMIDIDHFKHVNDEHGHAVGDVVICEVAKRISHAVRQDDLVVRWGGEEFLIYAADVTLERLGQLAERILQSVGGSPINVPKGPLRVTASIGFAQFPLPPTGLALHWEQAVNWADMALYCAKAKGRNRAMGIQSVLAEDSKDLSQIEADFDAACSAARVRLSEVRGPQAG